MDVVRADVPVPVCAEQSGTRCHRLPVPLLRRTSSRLCSSRQLRGCKRLEEAGQRLKDPEIYGYEAKERSS